MNKEQIFNKLLIFGIVLSFIFVFTIAFWWLYPYKVMSFQDGNGTFVSNKVKSGGYLEMHQNSCKYQDLPSSINRQFIDGFLYQVAPSTNNRPLGCRQITELIYVPKALPVDSTYRIRTVISFKVNPIRTVSYTVITEPFTVVK